MLARAQRRSVDSTPYGCTLLSSKILSVAALNRRELSPPKGLDAGMVKYAKHSGLRSRRASLKVAFLLPAPFYGLVGYIVDIDILSVGNRTQVPARLRRCAGIGIQISLKN